MPTYTARKVHQPLADALDRLGDAEEVTTLHLDRYSVADGSGIVAQLAAHAAYYPNDPDVQTYRKMPEASFARTAGNVALVSPSDVHHSLRDRRKTIVLTRIASTLFVRVEMSAVARSIVRPDGEDENAYTAFILALLGHHPRLREARWAGDITRFARDAVNATLITRKLRERGVLMSLSGTPYDLSDDANLLLLGVQTAVGANDDPTRRRKLLGAKLLKISAGGVGVSEEQMPYGYRVKRKETGQPMRNGRQGLVPEPDASAAEAIRTAYTMFADGATYTAICSALAQHEANGGFRRHLGSAGFARTFTEVSSQHGEREAQAAVKRLFAPATLPKWMPHPEKPSKEKIAAYLAGGDPQEIFTIPQQLLIARVELMRTGTYLRVLRNEIRQRDFVLHGFRATYLSDDDGYGFFALRPVWPLPVDPSTGEPGWGLDDSVHRKAAARLLTSLGRGRQPTGSRAHQNASIQRRAIQNIADWTQGGFEHKVVARHETKKKKANAILLRRPAHEATPLPGTKRRGWGNKTEKIVATWTLPALCTDVAQKITTAVESILDPSTIAPAVLVLPSQFGETEVWAAILARAEQLDQHAKEDERAATGARRLAAIVAAEDPEGAEAYIADARSHQASAQQKRAEANRMRQDVAEREAAAESATETEADVSILAYLVAGLTQAGRNRGFGPPLLGETADSLLGEWRFEVAPDEQWVNYTCTLTLPLNEGEASLPIEGRIPNVRSVRGRKMTRRNTLALRREHTYSELILRDGKTVEEAVAAMGDEMNRSNAIQERVRPALRKLGMTSRGLRGALLDHPVPLAQRVVYADLTGEHLPELDRLPAGLRAWRSHVATIYRSDMQWGDAAVPDDLEPVRAVIATLATDPSTGVTPAEIARAIDWLEPKVRRLFGKPAPRLNGFQRPRYAEYVGHVGFRGLGALGVIRCPHGRCRGVCDAVVLLPEVAASGFGVICSTCRRAPNTNAIWSRIVFPPSYLEPWTRQTDGRLALRDRPQTVLGPVPKPFPAARVSLGSTAA